MKTQCFCVTLSLIVITVPVLNLPRHSAAFTSQSSSLRFILHIFVLLFLSVFAFFQILALSTNVMRISCFCTRPLVADHCLPFLSWCLPLATQLFFCFPLFSPHLVLCLFLIVYVFWFGPVVSSCLSIEERRASQFMLRKLAGRST